MLVTYYVFKEWLVIYYVHNQYRFPYLYTYAFSICVLCVPSNLYAEAEADPLEVLGGAGDEYQASDSAERLRRWQWV